MKLFKKNQEINFNYYLDVDYSNQDCDDPNCDHEYGRCSTIEEASLKNIKLDRVVEAIFSNLPKSPSEILKYGVERICVCYKLWNEDLYNIKITGGYYGEEIDSVNLLSDVEDKLKFTIENFYKSEYKVEFLLELEYNKVLSKLNNKQWEIRNIKTDDLIAPQKHHLYMIKKNDNPYDKDYKGIVGVCVEENNPYSRTRYILCDGYHRFAAKCGDKKIKMLVGYDLPSTNRSCF